jgi:hypothetical protein
VMVAKQIEKPYTQTVMRPVTEQQVISCTEMVPEQVVQERQVPVTVYVAREVPYSTTEPPVSR